MIRRIVVIACCACLTAAVALVAPACKNEGAAKAGDGGGPAPKLYCKINGGCWICPDDAAMKKCIINPATSGCKAGSLSDCP